MHALAYASAARASIAAARDRRQRLQAHVGVARERIDCKFEMFSFAMRDTASTMRASSRAPSTRVRTRCGGRL